MPLPHYGFNPTEASIPWKILSTNNVQVIFATPKGTTAFADNILLTGKGLGILKPLLKARRDAINAYSQMEKSNAFKHPISYNSIQCTKYDGIFLPGGHDKNAKEYLESQVLQKNIVNFFQSNKKIAAICHGILLVARSINPKNNKSVLYKYKTTSLLKNRGF